MFLQLFCLLSSLIVVLCVSITNSEERLTKLTSNYRITCDHYESVGPYLVELQLCDEEYPDFHTCSTVWRICRGYCEIVTSLEKPVIGNIYWNNYWTLVLNVKHNCTQFKTDEFRTCTIGGNRRQYTIVDSNLYTDLVLSKVC